ncbi:transcription factor domain-containing protein [Aspergillus stella-maris]|uniref:transcription factor domain-containing protein n=1 Tax=Aspergillus stella-maris TaxID=1810926 RepID=UPI003CCCAC12
MNRKRHNRAADSPGEALKRKKIIACERCHSHKIKCSGDQPCTKCRQVGCADDCQYPSRDRQIKVSESYLEQLLSENQRLKAQSQSLPPSSANTPEQPSPSTNGEHPHVQPQRHPAAAAAAVAEGPDPRTVEETISETPESTSNTSVRNPLLDDRAWFQRYDPSAPPIFVGEAACTAFATRFRQFLTGTSSTAHIRRTQYVKEENIALANAGEIRWPSLQQARLLVKIAIRQITCVYHVLLRKATMEKLEEIYRTADFEDTTNQCKFFALFAFGEAYSMRTEPGVGSRVPGTSYFARSLSLVQVLPERTSITHLETLLLLSLYSYYLNRRHSAYVLIGSAMRLGLCIGLNHNIPESQVIDPVERQHRVRIWWTIYIFDRMWASKMGLPSQILDDDIHLDMPAAIEPKAEYEEQFTDAEFIRANINLARIVGETTAKVYSRRRYNETFLQRVQKLLRCLKEWVDTLPRHLRLNVDDPEMNAKHVTSIHLAFNQCVVLTTRPTLLHLLKLSESTTNTSTSLDKTTTQPLLTLSEACIHAARHSHSLILTRWINGSLPVFGYFHAHYLFSASLVLAMSSFVSVPVGSQADLGAFETGLEVLRGMSENGNLSASEFLGNLRMVRGCLEQYKKRRGRNLGHGSGDEVGDDEGEGEREREGDGPSHHRGAETGASTAPTLHQPAITAPAPAGTSSMSTPLPRPRLAHTTPTPASQAPLPSFLPHYTTPTTQSYSHSHSYPQTPQSQTYGQPQTTAQNDAHNQDQAQPQDQTGFTFTTAMAFMEPTMQDFLAQSDMDLGLLYPVESFMDEAENLYSGHEFS